MEPVTSHFVDPIPETKCGIADSARLMPAYGRRCHLLTALFQATSPAKIAGWHQEMATGSV